MSRPVAQISAACRGVVESLESRVFLAADIIIDNPAASLVGTWTSSTAVSGYYGTNFVHDGNTAKGAKSATYTPAITTAGNYEVFIRYTAHGNRASNVPVDVVHDGGTTTATVNQRVSGGTWLSLGVFAMNGAGDFARIRTDATNGYVIADAFRFVEQAATVTIPTAPSGLTATAATSSQINLAWTDNSSNEDGFYVDRSTGSSFTSVTTFTTGANTTSFQSTGLSANTTYYYRVRAYNSGGASANSSSAYATTPNITVNGPTDNPIQTKYGSSSYTWTSNINWANVFNAVDYGAISGDDNDDTAAFNAARDAAAAAGGGVVYFPAGTYDFDNDIYLKNGVVIRGATPSSSDAKASGYNPATNFEFPPYVFSKTANNGAGTSNTTAFKKISTTNLQTDSNIGIVNVDVNRAAIKLNADGLTNTNRNIVVFGNRSNNVAEPDSSVPNATYQNAWQRWSYRFASNIKVQADGNVIVANNRLNDAVTDNFDQIGYIAQNYTGTTMVTLNTSGQAVFNYTNHYGIEVNRSKSGSYAWGATPTTEPSLFKTGNTIRDNYVFHTMRVAIMGSGQGLEILNNVVRDQSGKRAWLNPQGTKLVSNNATLENRAIDWSGHGVTVSGNDYQVHQHLLRNTTYPSVDGEGILIQECCGGTRVNGVTIQNNTGNAYIGLYKMGDINNALISGNTVNGSYITVMADTGGSGGNWTPFTATNVVIENNTLTGGITLRASGGGSSNIIRNNTNPNGGNISYSTAANPTITGNTGFTLVQI